MPPTSLASSFWGLVTCSTNRCFCPVDSDVPRVSAQRSAFGYELTSIVHVLTKFDLMQSYELVMILALTIPAVSLLSITLLLSLCAYSAQIAVRECMAKLHLQLACGLGQVSLLCTLTPQTVTSCDSSHPTLNSPDHTLAMVALISFHALTHRTTFLMLFITVRRIMNGFLGSSCGRTAQTDCKICTSYDICPADHF